MENFVIRKRRGFLSWLTALLLVTSLPLFSAEMFKDPGSGTEFPTVASVTINGESHNLQATGASLRKKFVFRVYAIAHYIQNPPSGSTDQVISAIMASDEPKQMTMKWLRDVSRDRIVGGYRDTLKKVLGSKLGGVEQSLNQFLAFYKSEAKEGDIHQIRWLPGGVLELVINDQVQGQLQNQQLAQAFWAMWFGKHSVVNPKEMVSLIAN